MLPDDIRTSVLWKDAQEELKTLPDEVKLDLFLRNYPNEATLSYCLSPKQILIVHLMGRGYTYKEIAQEVGYSDKASVSVAVKLIRNKIIRSL